MKRSLPVFPLQGKRTKQGCVRIDHLQVMNSPVQVVQCRDRNSDDDVDLDDDASITACLTRKVRNIATV
eukprot:7223345-Ditylum_brightwellii.AAC.1